MQSPKYILKNKYQEKNAERNMQYHMKNLTQINTKLSVLEANKKEGDMVGQVERRKQNQQLATKFVINEVLNGNYNYKAERERNYENQSLLDRMVNINVNKQNTGSKVNSQILQKNQLTQSMSFMPKSLIAGNQKMEEDRIQYENFKLVQRMNNLPPVISSLDLQSSFLRHKDELKIASRYHKLHPLTAVPKPTTRFSIYTDILNEITNSQFESSKSMIQFPIIDDKIHKNTLLCIFQIQALKLFNDYDLNNPKIPPKFCWELKYKKKSLCMTLPKSFIKASQDIADALLKKNAKDKVELILWKIKNNDEQYIGQIDFDPDDFDEAELIQEFKHKQIKEKLCDKELYRKINNVNAFLGQVQVKMIQFCHKNIPSSINIQLIYPQDKHSNIPGSPRDPKIRRQNQIITDGYEWQTSPDEEHFIMMLEEATRRGISIMIMEPELVSAELRARFAEKADLISQLEQCTGPDQAQKRMQFFRAIKKKEAQMVRDILKEIENNPQLVEQYRKMITYRGRVPKSLIDEALAEKTFTNNQLFLQCQDEMGISLVGIMLQEDQLPAFLEIFASIDILKESDQVIDNLSKEIFKNIGYHVRKSKWLKATQVFIKSLQNYPGMGLVINSNIINIYIKDYANLDMNKGIAQGKCNSFLSNFDLEKYEHLIILGKVIKLGVKYLLSDNEWLNSLQQTHKAYKKNLFFKIPVLPKKGDIMLKQDLLSLNDGLQMNIFHEAVRRRKYGLIHKSITLPDALPWMFQKDCTGQNAFMNMMGSATFDAVMIFFQLTDGLVLQEGAIENSISDAGRNVFHEVVNNKELSQPQLFEVLQKIIATIGDETTDRLLQSAWYLGPKQSTHKEKEFRRSQDILPLTNYLHRLSLKTKKNKKILKDIPIIIEIIKILSRSFQTNLTIQQQYIRFDNQEEEEGDYLCIEKSYAQNAQVVRMLCTFDDEVYNLIIGSFVWINWYSPSFQEPCHKYLKKKSNSSNIHQSVLLTFLRSGKYAKFIQVVESLNIEDLLVSQNFHTLTCCLKEALELNDKDTQGFKQTIVQCLQGRIKIIINKQPEILFITIRGVGLCNREASNESLINQLYALNQDSLIPQTIEQKFITDLGDENVISILNAALKYHKTTFKDHWIFEQLLLRSNSLQQRVLAILLENLNSTSKDQEKDLQMYVRIVEKIPKLQLQPEHYNKFGYRLLIELPKLLRDLIQSVDNKEDKVEQLVSLAGDSEALAENVSDAPRQQEKQTCKALESLLSNKQLRLKDIKYFVGLNRGDSLLDHLNIVVQNVSTDIASDLAEKVLFECLSCTPNAKGLYAGFPISYYMTFIQINGRIFKNFNRCFDHFLRTHNYTGLHYLLLFDSSREERSTFNSLAIVNWRDREVYPYFIAMQYKTSHGFEEGRFHWCLTLNSKQFASMLLEIKDHIQDSEMNKIMELLCVYGLADKLKMVIDKIKDEGCLISTLKRQLQRGQDQLSVVKVILPKTSPVDKTPPPFYEKCRLFGLSKWSSIVGVNQLMNQIYKQAWPYSNRLKGAVFYQGIIEKQLQKLEYGNQLRKSFLNQNFRSIFGQYPEDSQQDNVLVLQILVESISVRQQVLDGMSKEDRNDFIRDVSQKAWVSVIPEKLQEWFQNYQPCNGFAILSMLRGALEFFQLNNKNMVVKEKLMTTMVTYFKKSLNSKMYQSLNYRNSEFHEIVGYLSKPFEQNNKQINNGANKTPMFKNKLAIKFSTEIILIIDQNFIAQEMSNLKSISDGQHLLNFFASLLLISQNTDKRVIQFLQKHLSRKVSYKYFRIDSLDETQDYATTTFVESKGFKLNPSNAEFVVQLAKQGVLCILEQNTLRLRNKDQVLNPMEFLLASGCDYLLNSYFLGQLKPKGVISEEDKVKLIQCALHSGNLNCLSIVFDDILALKGPELKATILNLQIMGSVASLGNQSNMLWLLRKKLRTIDTFTIDEALSLMSMDNDQKTIEPKSKFLPLLVYVTQKNMSSFYKEFFQDFLLKIVCKNIITDYSNLMVYILLFKREQWSDERQYRIVTDEVQMNLLEYTLSFQFYDVIQTIVSMELKFIGHPKFDLESHKEIMKSNQQAISNKYGFLSSQMIDNLLRQDNFQQMNVMQALLRLYKTVKTQTQIGANILELNSYERSLFIALYYKNYLPSEELKITTDEPIAKVIFNFLTNKYNWTQLSEISNVINEKKSPILVLFLLHIYNIDKTLQFNMSLEKFVEKHQVLRQNKLFTQLWRNKEALEQLGLLLNENFSEGMRTRTIQTPTPKQINEFVKQYQKDSMMPLLEYFALNDPEIFLEGINIFHDQRLLMIVLRSAADKNQPEIIESFLDVLTKGAQFFEDDINAECIDFQRNILVGFTTILMINPSKMSKSVIKRLQQISWIGQLDESLPPIAQILAVIFSSSGYSLSQYSCSLRILMEQISKNYSYNMMCEIKPTGDLGINISEEKVFIDSLKAFIENILKEQGHKAFLPLDTFTKINAQSAQPSLIVHGDKFFKGFSLIKTLVDLAWNIEILSKELLESEYQQIGELEYRVEVLPSEQAQKQSIMLLQQGVHQETKLKFLFKLPMGIQKNESTNALNPLPTPLITQAQIEQAKYTLNQVYLDKFLKAQWNEQIIQMNPPLKVQMETVTVDNMDSFQKNKDKILPSPNTYEAYIPYFQLNDNNITDQLLTINNNNKDQGLSFRFISYIDVPFSNYQVRQRKTSIKLRMENEYSFPEFYPSQVQAMKPNYSFAIVQEVDFNKRLRPINLITFIVQELYSYCGLVTEMQRLKRDGVTDQNLQKLPLLSLNVFWPGYFNSITELITAPELDPCQFIFSLQERFTRFEYNIPSKVPLKFSILSFVDTFVLRLASTMEKSMKIQKTIDFYRVLDIAFQWDLIRLTVMQILELLESSGCNIFKGIYIEMNEVEPKRCYESKPLSNQLEGLDAIFRMAPAQFFVHQGILIVRLNFAAIRADCSPLDSLVNKSAKIRNLSTSNHMFQENIELKNYLTNIANKDNLIKQILAQKKN